MISADLNINNPVMLRIAGMEALSNALGPVGMAKFLQQFETGYGDYTKEKYEEKELSFDEIENMISKL